jgi:subtilisin family serine protease
MSLDDWFGLNTLPPKILKALARRVDTVVAQSDRVRAAHRDYIECTRRMTEAGAFMVVCAGNQGLDQQELRASPGASLSFLAESPYVISVGGYDENDCLSSFSSSGSSKYHPLVLAPGFFLARDGERLTGTSIGAPYVAATIALMLQQNPDLNLQQVSSILKSTARPLKSVSPLLQGAGRVDVCAAVKAAQRARKGPHQSAGA